MPAPSTSDLTTYLSTLGVTAPAAIDEAAILASVTDELEMLTGRIKFQGDSTLSSVQYTLTWPQGQNVILPILNAHDVDEVRINYQGAGTGQPLTEMMDYELIPENAYAKVVPYDAIRFLGTPSTSPGSILVTCKLGVAANMPQDVFNAILARSAAQVVLQIAGVSGSVADEKQGDRAVKFDLTQGRATIDRLMAEFNACVKRWKKMWL
jgi:hypothetical protein